MNLIMWMVYNKNGLHLLKEILSMNTDTCIFDTTAKLAVSTAVLVITEELLFVNTKTKDWDGLKQSYGWHIACQLTLDILTTVKKYYFSTEHKLPKDLNSLLYEKNDTTDEPW